MAQIFTSQGMGEARLIKRGLYFIGLRLTNPYKYHKFHLSYKTWTGHTSKLAHSTRPLVMRVAMGESSFEVE